MFLRLVGLFSLTTGVGICTKMSFFRVCPNCGSQIHVWRGEGRGGEGRGGKGREREGRGRGERRGGEGKGEGGYMYVQCMCTSLFKVSNSGWVLGELLEGAFFCFNYWRCMDSLCMVAMVITPTPPHTHTPSSLHNFATLGLGGLFCCLLVATSLTGSTSTLIAFHMYL